MDYVTFFDVSQAGYRQWTFPAFGFIGVFLGLLGLLYRSRLIRYPWAVLIFSVVWTIGAFQCTYPAYAALSAALAESRCEVVEGRVTDFQLLPPTGIQKAESFVVAGTRFKYAGGVATAGFTQMRSQGGPMRDGLQVRIHHFHGEIARLEIATATP